MHPDTAQIQNLNGIGGWLILVIIGLVVTPIPAIAFITSDIMAFFEPDVWYSITTYGTDSYHPLFAPMIIYELVINIALILVPIILLFLLFKKSRYFPKAMIIYLIGVLVTQFCDLYFVYVVFSSLDIPTEAYEETINASTIATIQICVYAAIWMPYFIYSKRVKTTFLNQLY